jgi:hypothetical protein
MVEAATFFASSCRLYRSTMARFNANCGSEQYHSMNSSIACWYDRRDWSDVRLLRTDFLAWSSLRQSTPVGVGLLPLLGFHGRQPPLSPLDVLRPNHSWRVGLATP